ncbi:uncharacterized protein LOC120780388 [Bactrocera tryoni]|uniref:uncharacterized protein LOC120780388 n=1 Tax=Bactrocera tryoni TaxID=59916 RepID=UPI001A96920D|nr:uncharacterized protein LOC120780388 [Bactrocera tryoni]
MYINSLSATKSVYQVSIIKNIIGSIGVTNGMKKILSDSVMVQLNYDGLQDKVASKKFECLNNAIYEAMQVEGFSKGDYERELKRAFKMGKNRYHKAIDMDAEMTTAPTPTVGSAVTVPPPFQRSPASGAIVI